MTEMDDEMPLCEMAADHHTVLLPYRMKGPRLESADGHNARHFGHSMFLSVCMKGLPTLLVPTFRIHAAVVDGHRSSTTSNRIVAR
jgi:hypothetical protein